MSKDGERIICPKCGSDLGPIQPLRHSLAKCLKCKLWVNNQSQESSRSIHVACGSF
ncbi:MAG TPA: hypothetical protein PKY47_04940 [Acetomicrobium sp.]|nr:hypothetical protein [Acetomicrobium sp.]